MSELPQQALYGLNERADVRPFIPCGATSALDVGCGRGGFGKTLRSRLGPDALIVGVEAVPEQVEEARRLSAFDEVVLGYFPDALAHTSDTYDLVTFNDVLEHMLEPEQVLRDTHRFLNSDGRVVAAIPSIQFAPVVLQLLRGRWDYADQGTLDRTHVRFFTRSTMIEMFERAGYRVERCEGVNDVRDSWSSDPVRIRRWAKLLLSRALSDSRYLHFVIVATPATD